MKRLLRVLSRPAPADEQDLRREFEAHVAFLTHDEMCRGLDEAAARRRALERFGDQEKHLRACRPAGAQPRKGIIMADTIAAPAARRRGLVVAWNIVLAAGVLGALLLALDARSRANFGFGIGGAPNRNDPLAVQEAVLRSVWVRHNGEVEVAGNVPHPGKFYVSVDQPLSISQLVRMAGGPSQESTHVTWKLPDSNGEAYITLANAIRAERDFNTMPAPGSVLTVR